MTTISKMQASEENMIPADGNEALPPEAPETIETVTAVQNCGGGNSLDDDISGNPPDSVRESVELGNNTAGICRNGEERASEHLGENGNRISQADNHVSGFSRGSLTISGQISETNGNLKLSHAVSLVRWQYMLFWFGETTEQSLWIISF